MSSTMRCQPADTLKIQHELLPHANRFLTEQHGPPCTCGDRREWIRIAHLQR